MNDTYICIFERLMMMNAILYETEQTLIEINILNINIDLWKPYCVLRLVDYNVTSNKVEENLNY